MRSKKILIIVITILIIMLGATAVFGYLFVATDTFKSDKELFSKYMGQNIESIEMLMNSSTIEKYEQLETIEKYELNTTIGITHSEGGEVSNPFNNLSAKLDVQKDGTQYSYADAQILYGEDEYLEIEAIKQDELYGVRFSDVVKQFVTVRDDENLEAVANDIGIEAQQLKEIMQMFDGVQEVMNQNTNVQEILTLKEKCLNIITETISQGTFGKIKNAMITYNNNTVETNAYTLQLSSEQVKSMITKIEKLISDEQETNEDALEMEIENEDQKEYPSIKITIYEQEQNVIRTVVEIGAYKIILENNNFNAQQIIKIQLSEMLSETVKECNIEIMKNTAENAEKYQITITIVDGEESDTIVLESNMETSENQVGHHMKINYTKEILTIGVAINNKLILDNINSEKQSLDTTNNVVLNDLEQTKRKNTIDLLKIKVPEKVETRINLLSKKLEIAANNSEDIQVENEEEISQVEINRFNAKFEFYVGNTVSGQNVKTLLEIVKDNLKSSQIIQIENSEDNETNDVQDEKYTIKLDIEKDVKNEEQIDIVLQKIEEDKKYKVSIVYKQENGLIDYITINEVE